MESPKMTCCFCGKPLNKYGGNSTSGGFNAEEEHTKHHDNDRCCDECNMNIVIPRRFEVLKLRQNGNE